MNTEDQHMRGVNEVVINKVPYISVTYGRRGNDNYRNHRIPLDGRYDKKDAFKIGKFLRMDISFGNPDATVESTIRNHKELSHLEYSGLDSTNTSGIAGVFFTKNNNSWRAYFGTPSTSTHKSASFSIKKFGNDKAKRKAITLRKLWEGGSNITRKEFLKMISGVC
jgi:hypothetical protein